MVEALLARRVGLVTTHLEQAVLDAAVVLREGKFGRALQATDPGRRCAQMGERVSPDCTPLAEAEVMLGMGPPIRRTLAAIELAEIEDGTDIAATDPEYAAWVEAAHWAFRRIAGKCWGPIRQSVRTAVLDLDDFNPLVWYYIPGSRSNRLGPALAFEGLDSSKVTRALERVYRATRETAVHAEAREALRIVSERPSVLAELRRSREEILEEIRESAPSLGELRSRASELLEETYSRRDPDVALIATRLRETNALINHVLCFLLSYAANDGPAVSLSQIDGSVRTTTATGVRCFHFTFADAAADAFIRNRPPFGFEVRSGGPMDGLYLTFGMQFQFSHSGMADVEAIRLADLERVRGDN